MTIQEMSGSYDSEIVVRRWAATWTDFGFLIVLFGLVDALAGFPSDWFAVLVFFGVPTVYHTVLEGLLAFTPGKWLCGIRVTDTEGRVPGARRALVRTLLRLIEVNPLLLGGVPAGLVANYTKWHQRLGDLLAGTYVLRLQDIHQHFPTASAGRVRGPYSRFLESRVGSQSVKPA